MERVIANKYLRMSLNKQANSDDEIEGHQFKGKYSIRSLTLKILIRSITSVS